MLRTIAGCVVVLALGSPVRGAEIAVLKSTDSPAWRPALDAMKRGLVAHTVSELDLRGDKSEADRVVGLLRGKAAVIVAMGPLAVQAARDGAPDVPLVACMLLDPARAGVQAGPGVTGVMFQTPIKNQFAAFRMVNPRGVRIGVVYNAENTGRLVQEAQKGAPVVRLTIVEKVIVSDKEVPQALRALLQGATAVDALWVPPDPLLLGDEARRFLLTETLKAGKPIYTFSAGMVGEGALVSNGVDMASIGEQAAELANRLAGADKTAKIDFTIPRAELVINKKIADKLKIEIPPDALKAAAKVY
jgi:putative ABC transport system substrate-binding protein